MKTKLLIIIFFFVLFVSNTAFAQVPNWQWAKSGGAANSENGNSVITDASGNVYVIGYFFSPSITFGSYTLTNAGNYDIFIVKYDPLGNVIWAKSSGGIYDDVGYSVAADLNGNILVTGYYYSPSITLGSYTLTNAGGGDIFIVKYDPSGNVLWAKSEGGTFDDNGYGITTDALGNIFITGSFQSANLTSGNYTLTNAGNDDVFILKYDGLGNTLWAKSGGGSGNDQGNSIATDANGNVYITGFFYSTSFILETFTLTTAGSGDIFVVKYDVSGNVLWAKRGGGNFNESGNSIATDATGNVFVTGSFLSSTLTIGIYTCTNTGNYDIFIAKYDAVGNELWVKSGGGIFDDAGYGIVTDGIGNAYLTGHFHSPSITLGTYTLSNSGIGDIYVAQCDATGNIVWAKDAGGTADEQGSSISLDATGNIYVTGYFYSPSIVFSNNTLLNAGSADMFVAKLESLPTSITELTAENNKIQIYPNPSTGEFYIKNDEFKIKSVEIFNDVGQKIFEAEIHQTNYPSINISNQPKGIYFISLKTEKETVSDKLIVQ